MPPRAAHTGAAWPAAVYWEARARGEGLGKGPEGLSGISGMFRKGTARRGKGDVSGALHWRGADGF